MPRVQFQAAESIGGFRPAVPEADYILEIASIVGPKASKASGNPMLAIAYLIKSEGTYKGRDDNGNETECDLAEFELHRQEARPDYFSLTPQAGWKIKRLLEVTETPHQAIPVELPDGKQGWDIDFDTDDLLHKRFLGHVVQEPFVSQGKNRIGNSVTAYAKIGG